MTYRNEVTVSQRFPDDKSVFALYQQVCGRLNDPKYGFYKLPSEDPGSGRLSRTLRGSDRVRLRALHLREVFIAEVFVGLHGTDDDPENRSDDVLSITFYFGTSTEFEHGKAPLPVDAMALIKGLPLKQSEVTEVLLRVM